uniref:F-box domain-containing protein n=1 Tax=Oryza brachyantha TaxID=4533 RepID=J3N0Q1_ORYBR
MEEEGSWLGSPAKVRKVTAPAQGDGQGLFSGVADDVVRHIMSFLPTREAVRTCVVSRRGRDLWRSVPCIDADIIDYKRRDTDEEQYDERGELAFMMFMNKVMELRYPATIRTFRLRCILDLSDCFDFSSCYAKFEDINRWISHAVQKQIRVLDIVLFCDRLELDHSAFDCSYLTTIEFTSVILMEGFFEQLEMGCPAVESLFLDE